MKNFLSMLSFAALLACGENSTSNYTQSHREDPRPQFTDNATYFVLAEQVTEQCPYYELRVTEMAYQQELLYDWFDYGYSERDLTNYMQSVTESEMIEAITRIGGEVGWRMDGDNDFCAIGDNILAKNTPSAEFLYRRGS